MIHILVIAVFSKAKSLREPEDKSGRRGEKQTFISREAEQL